MAQEKTKTQMLLARAAILIEPQVGDLVVLKNADVEDRLTPSVGQPAVVTEVLSAGDIRLAFTGRAGRLHELLFDSHRFRIATQEEIAAWDAA